MGKELDKEVSKESDKEVDKEMGWAFLRPVMRAQVRRGGGPAQPMIATGNAKIAGSLYNCRCLTAVIHGYTSNDTKRYTQTPQAFKTLYFLADGFRKYIWTSCCAHMNNWDGAWYKENVYLCLCVIRCKLIQLYFLLLYLGMVQYRQHCRIKERVNHDD